ncbi:MAG TPA: hypothetical protein PKW99_03015 [Thauera sp.]|nr:hypothetical protein [Thauera sp.]
MHFPLTIPLRPSRRFMASILVAHVAAGLALLHVPDLSSPQAGLPWTLLRVLGLLLWFSLAGSLLLAIRQERAKQGRVLVLRADGALVFAGTGGAEVDQYWLAVGSTDFGWAVWLPLTRLSPAPNSARWQATRRLMLLRSNMPESYWRPMRIWLRYKSGPSQHD